MSAYDSSAIYHFLQQQCSLQGLLLHALFLLHWHRISALAQLAQHVCHVSLQRAISLGGAYFEQCLAATCPFAARSIPRGLS